MFPQMHQIPWVSFPGVGTAAPEEVLAHGVLNHGDTHKGKKHLWEQPMSWLWYKL